MDLVLRSIEATIISSSLWWHCLTWLSTRSHIADTPLYEISEDILEIKRVKFVCCG